MLKTLSFTLTLLLSSCCLIGSCPNHASFHISAARYLNPDEAGHPKPLVITFYQLGNSSRFSELSYEQLSNNPSATLGNKLIDQQDVEVQPGKTSSENIALKPNTAAIGVVASYEHIGSNKWKAIIPIMSAGKQIDKNINLTLESRNILIGARKGIHLW